MRNTDVEKINLSPDDFYETDIILRDRIGLIDISLISSVEFRFGPVRKLYPQDVIYDEQKGVFTVRFSAEEAGQILGVTRYQARIKFKGGGVKGTDTYTGRVLDCMCVENLTSQVPYSVNGCGGVARNGKRLAQGDTYELPVVLKRSGELVTPESVASIEFIFGTLRKRYPDEVLYDAESGAYIVVLSQEETFAFCSELSYYALVEGMDGTVEPSCTRTVNVEQSLSKEVL